MSEEQKLKEITARIKALKIKKKGKPSIQIGIFKTPITKEKYRGIKIIKRF